MSRWTDPETLRKWQAGGWGRSTLGRAVRRMKHREALQRNARTPHEHRRAYREGPAGRRSR